MLYTLENHRLRAKINSRGAELCSLLHRPSGQETIWQGAPAIWAGHSPLLFPIVGKLKGDGYRWEGQAYPMPKHGFARTSEFSLAAQSQDSLTLTLTDSPATQQGYPFAFALSLSFVLRESCLEITHTVHNPSSASVLPFSIGAHPGFQCALGDHLEFERPEAPSAYYLGPDLLLSPEPKPISMEGSRLTLTPELFAEDALILQNPRSRSLTLVRKGEHPRVRVDWFDAPVLGLWARPGAPYVCVEPWYGIDDSAAATGQIAEKDQILLLPPGESFHFPVHITLLPGGSL